MAAIKYVDEPPITARLVILRVTREGGCALHKQVEHTCIAKYIVTEIHSFRFAQPARGGSGSPSVPRKNETRELFYIDPGSTQIIRECSRTSPPIFHHGAQLIHGVREDAK